MDLKELETWFQGRPKWLQDAARRLIQNGSLNEQDYADLYTICSKEVISPPVAYAGIPTGSLNIQDTAQPLRLDSIADVKDVNALSPSKPLEFGEKPLCIVYGLNATGKSGYVRLLKHACGARRPGDLLPNVFSTASKIQSATLRFTVGDGASQPVQWTKAPIPELQGVEIYDTVCGFVYVNEENEVAFEPWLLRLFTQLTNACTTLSAKIQKSKEGLISKKPTLPPEYETTSAGQWYANFTFTMTDAEVNAKTLWRSEDEASRSEANRRLAETNPAARAVSFRGQKNVILALENDLRKLFEGLSEGRCNAYLNAKLAAATKRKAADEYAKAIFEKAPLTGIGSESWLLLWEAARKYSEEHAYKNSSFPNVAEDALCVLCQQTLNRESRERFSSFEEFVKGDLQRLATEAESLVLKTEKSFPEVQTTEEITRRLQPIGIPGANLLPEATALASALAMRRQTCLAAVDMAGISAMPHPQILAQLHDYADELEKLALACDEDAKGQNRSELEQKAKGLSAQKWLSEQRKGIDEEVQHLKLLKVLEEMDRLTNTQALSARKAKLTEVLITTAYIERFRDELVRLKASGLKVEVQKTRAQVGRVYHRIILRDASQNCKTPEVLSEGEVRILSLAAFLADTEGRGAKTPFIFDDPISSLDHVYEEATAKRLVELSKDRQVIVFTHRLSLVGFLEKYAEKCQRSHTLACLSHYRIGEITELPINLKNTKAAANGLANERLAAAKKAFDDGDEAYEKEAKALCGDIRNLLERIVEKDLLNDIVRRFSAEVNTKGKIHKLAEITKEDCEFIDRFMTRYSVFEHSQPEETPVTLPKPDEIEKDLNEITGFIDKVRGRLKN